MNIAGPSSQVEGVSLEHIVETVRQLHEQGLVFEENGTYMNLVFA